MYVKCALFSKKEHEDYIKYENIGIKSLRHNKYKLYSSKEHGGYVKYENISINTF